MKTTVIYHSADFDGLFCREIARKFLPNAELVGWDFGQPLIPFPKEGTVYILDLSADCIQASDIPDDWQKRLIWIDHHKTSIEKWADNIPGYRIDGVAACRLAWQWFSLAEHNAQNQSNDAMQIPLPSKQDYIDRILPEPVAVRLAGEYDIWDKRDPNAEVFQFGLQSRELTEENWKWLLTVRDSSTQGEYALAKTNCAVMELLEDGRLLQKYQQRNDAGMMGRSFIVQWEGLKFLALTTARCNSLTFAAKDLPATGHDALMGFYYDGANWNFSLYHAKHNTGIDLSLIASKYGGGGHRGACGFRVQDIPFTI